MALFGDKEPFSYETIREGEDTVLIINCETYPRIPSIEDDPITMSRTIEILSSEPNVTKIIFQQKRNYEYDYNQTNLLKEISRLQSHLAKNKDLFSYTVLNITNCTKCLSGWYAELQNLVSSTVKSDPAGAYVELKRIGRRESIKAEKAIDVM